MCGGIHARTISDNLEIKCRQDRASGRLNNENNDNSQYPHLEARCFGGCARRKGGKDPGAHLRRAGRAGRRLSHRRQPFAAAPFTGTQCRGRWKPGQTTPRSFCGGNSSDRLLYRDPGCQAGIFAKTRKGRQKVRIADSVAVCSHRSSVTPAGIQLRQFQRWLLPKLRCAGNQVRREVFFRLDSHALQQFGLADKVPSTGA
jgi:hypothetical protein